MESRRNFCICILLAAIFLASCAGSGQFNSPVIPAVSGENQVDVTGQNEPAEIVTGSHYLWAYSFILYDASKNTLEILPARTVDTHWNILKWLEQAPCTNCLAITSFTDSGSGTKLVGIKIRHPFPNPNFTGFDVRGITMFSGSYLFTDSGLTTSDSSQGDGELVNADGFTTLYNSTTAGSGFNGLQGYIKGKFATATMPDALLNGFKRYKSDDALNTRNAFYAGDEITQTFEIKMPSGSFVLGYAVDASWAAPLVSPVTDPIADFGPDANCPEAWKLDVSETPIGLGLTRCGGSSIITIDTYDWQGKDNSHLPTIECGELFDGVVTANWKSDGSGYARYEAIISNTNEAPAGDYECLIIKIADENDGAPAWLDLSAYCMMVVEVAEVVDQPPTCWIEPVESTCPYGEGGFFSGLDSFDNDCDGKKIVKYEYDWMNDGNFVEEPGETSHEWNVPGVYNVQLRVTDDEGSTDLLDEPATVWVVDNDCPTAYACAVPNPQQINLPVEFDASDSFDTDGTIVSYEWDWENDGIFDEEGVNVQHSWPIQDFFEVQLRVTDDLGCSDTLDEPLEVLITEDGNICPTADAWANPTTEYTNNPISFYDNGSIDPDGTLVSHEWDWDNDGTYDEDDPYTEHSWPTAGTYYVQYRVVDDDGCPDELDQPIEIEILPWIEEDPVAFADADPITQQAGNPIHIFDDGSFDPDGGLIVSWEWDYNADGTYEDAGEEIWYQSDDPGVFYFQLRVTDDEGATDLLDTPLQVWFTGGGDPPEAIGTAFPNPQLICENVTLSDDGSWDPDGGGITLVEWDTNNDGTFELSGSPVNVNTLEYGENFIQMRVTDDEGMSDTLDTPLIVNIYNSIPTAVADTEKFYPLPSDSFQLDGSGSHDNDCSSQDIVNWEWDIQNDGIYDYTGETVYISYAAPGTYHVQLRVTDDEDETDTLNQPLTIVVEEYPVPVDETPPWLRGGTLDIDTYGNYAYFAYEGEGVVVMDYSDPQYPEYVSWFEPGIWPTQGVCVSGSNLFTCDNQSGVHVYSLSDPANPTFLKGIATQSIAYDCAVWEGYAYVTDGIAGLQVIDIDPLDSASIVRTVDIDHATYIAVEGNYAYVSDSYDLKIVDISIPELANVIKTLTMPDVITGIAVSSGYVYVSDWYGGFKVIDVNPVEFASVVKTIGTGGYALDVSLSGNYAYFTDSVNGVNIVNISDPPNASLVNWVCFSNPNSNPRSITVSGDYVIAAWFDLAICDVNPPLSAGIVSYIESTTYTASVAAAGDYAYLINQPDLALQVIDINPPNMSHYVASVPLDDTATMYGYGMDFWANYAFVTNGSVGLEVVDITNPEIPAISAFISTMGYANAVDCWNGYAFVADHDAGLTIVDIDPLVSSSIVKNVPLGYNASGVVVDGEYAYVAANEGSYFIVDINPIADAFILKNVLTTGAYGMDIEIQNGYAYLGEWNQIGIADIVPPGDASEINSIYAFGSTDLAVHNGYVYTGLEIYGVGIYDIDPPELMHLDQTFHPWGDSDPNCIFLHNDLVLLGEGSHGLRVVRLW